MPPSLDRPLRGHRTRDWTKVGDLGGSLRVGTGPRLPTVRPSDRPPSRRLECPIINNIWNYRLVLRFHVAKTRFVHICPLGVSLLGLLYWQGPARPLSWNILYAPVSFNPLLLHCRSSSSTSPFPAHLSPPLLVLSSFAHLLLAFSPPTPLHLSSTPSPFLSSPLLSSSGRGFFWFDVCGPPDAVSLIIVE